MVGEAESSLPRDTQPGSERALPAWLCSDRHRTGPRLPAQSVQAPALGTPGVGSEPGLRIGMELPLTPSFCLPCLPVAVTPEPAFLDPASAHVSSACSQGHPGCVLIPCCDFSPASLPSSSGVIPVGPYHRACLSPSMRGRTSQRSWGDQCLAE